MYRLRSAPRPLIALVGAAAIIAAAGGGATPSAAPSDAPVSVAPSAEPSLVAVTPEPVGAVGPNGGKVVRWFIGIGSGGKPEQIAAEQKFAQHGRGVVEIGIRRHPTLQYSPQARRVSSVILGSRMTARALAI